LSDRACVLAGCSAHLGAAALPSAGPGPTAPRRSTWMLTRAPSSSCCRNPRGRPAGSGPGLRDPHPPLPAASRGWPWPSRGHVLRGPALRQSVDAATAGPKRGPSPTTPRSALHSRSGADIASPSRLRPRPRRDPGPPSTPPRGARARPGHRPARSQAGRWCAAFHPALNLAGPRDPPWAVVNRVQAQRRICAAYLTGPFVPGCGSAPARLTRT